MPDRPVALVTGASSGIGAAFARRLAADGHDLVVVARDVSRLEALAAELADAHGAGVDVLAADLCDREQLATVEDRVAQVDVLVNNAGFGLHGQFVALSLERQQAMVDLNVVALTRLAHAAAGPMVARGRGTIVNVGSVGSFAPAPGWAVYAATKAFVLSFTEALHEEVRRHGVKVVALCPGFTETEFQARSGLAGNGGVPSIARQTAEQVVSEAMRAVKRNDAVVVSGTPNKLLVGTTRFTPRFLVRKIAGGFIRE